MAQLSDGEKEKAKKLVDFIVASDALEGIETPPEEKEELLQFMLGDEDSKTK